ncbi:DUF6233 domain-containing protein [Streptomyces griseus]|uniref:DUF6233 domain-containing protein n=1 Tax=Streptomyces griseus TaxID=1911 RepID=UPI0037A539FC
MPRREPTSDWGISSAGIGRYVAELHRGDCFAGGAMQPLSAERARAELADGVPAYGVCRPDRVLNRMGPDADRVGADRAVWACGTGSGFLKYGSGPWFRWRPCSRRQARLVRPRPPRRVSVGKPGQRPRARKQDQSPVVPLRRPGGMRLKTIGTGVVVTFSTALRK